MQDLYNPGLYDKEAVYYDFGTKVPPTGKLRIILQKKIEKNQLLLLSYLLINF